MGRRITLNYDPVVLVVTVDVDQGQIVAANVDWSRAEGVVRPVERITDEIRSLEMEARKIIDETGGHEWPRISP
jgi:hypothetical protein